MRRFPLERLACLTEETVETLYLLGEEARIVGVSGCAVRPPEEVTLRPGALLAATIAASARIRPAGLLQRSYRS
jgi:hypothetical protein